MAKIEIGFVGPSGIPCSGTLERVVDGLFRQAYAEVFVGSLPFASKAFPLIEGGNDPTNNGGSYRQTLIGDTWLDGLYLLRVHNTAKANQVIGAQVFSVKSGLEVPVGYEGTVLNVYHADIQLNKNGLTNVDEYTVTWFTNGVIVNPSNVTLEVINRADGTDLVPVTPMTQIGASSSYKYDAGVGQRQLPGNTYLVISRATIDGATRMFSWNIGRDV